MTHEPRRGSTKRRGKERPGWRWRVPDRCLNVSGGGRGRERVKACPEGRGCAPRGRRDSEARARGCVVPAGLGGACAGTRGPSGDRGRAGTRGPGGDRAQLEAGGRRPVHSPSRAFFFLASVPPNLPRKDSSFFILGGRRGDERSCGAEDMGRGGHRRPGAGAALGGAAWWPPRRPIARGVAGGRGPNAGSRPAPAAPAA